LWPNCILKIDAPLVQPKSLDDQGVGLLNIGLPRGRGLSFAPIEQIGPERVVYHAQNETNRWPDENATDRARLDNPDAGSADDANGRKGRQDGTTDEKTNKGGRSPRRQGENKPAKLLAETAGRLEGLVSRIYFPIQTLQK
jgi:hypothetical protein